MITARFLRDDYPVNIHLCKDRTLSYRERKSNAPVFNGVAVPVLSVASVADAEALILLCGTRQYDPHPHPRFPHADWMKLFNGIAEGRQYLEPSDVPAAEEYLAKAYERIKETR